MKFKEFYDVELVTDNAGKELFIDKLELPYTSVKVVLDDLNDYHTDLWALGKIYTYSIQKEPFIHVDNDVFIWESFRNEVIDAALTAHHLECNYKHNIGFLNDVLTSFSYVPQIITETYETEQGITEANAGILGGNNLNFIAEYTTEAFRFVDRNVDKIKLLNYKGMFNTIFEQYLFYCMAQEQKIDIEYLIKEEIDDSFRGLADFWQVPHQQKYIHTVGFFKNHYSIGEQITQRLWFEYPEYYEHIIKYYKGGLL